MNNQTTKSIKSTASLVEGKYDFNYLTNDKAIEAKDQILGQLKTKGYGLPVQLENSPYKKSKITDFHIFDGKLDLTIEYTYIDYYSGRSTISNKIWDIKRAIGEVRTIKNGFAQKFLDTLATIAAEVNKQAKPDIKIRRNNTVFGMITPEIAKEFKNHIKKIRYRIPLIDTYDFDVDRNDEPLTDKALKKLGDIFDNFSKLEFAEDARNADMVENRSATEDTNHNIENSWNAVGNITFDCPINKLSPEAQEVIRVSKVKKADDTTSASDTTNTTSCYRLANALIKYFDNDIFFFKNATIMNESTKNRTNFAKEFKLYESMFSSNKLNNLFVDFDKPLKESAAPSQWAALKMIRKYLVEVGGIEFYAEDLEDTFAVWFLGHELGDESFGIFDLNTLSITDEINSSDAVAIYDDLEEFFAYNEEAYEVCLEIAKKYYNK